MKIGMAMVHQHHAIPDSRISDMSNPDEFRLWKPGAISDGTVYAARTIKLKIAHIN